MEALEQESRLIAEVKQGQNESFYELVRPYERKVYLTALAILGDAAEAEDAAQESIVKAFENLQQFKGEARFSTWLLRIAINEARGRLRRHRRVRMEPLFTQTEEGEVLVRDVPDERELPSRTIEREELKEILRRGLLSLRPSYRKVLVLRDVMELSTSETAHILRIRPGNVKTRLLRARTHLREFVTQVWKAPSTVAASAAARVSSISSPLQLDAASAGCWD